MGTSPASSEIQKRIREIVQPCKNALHIKDDIIVYGIGKKHDGYLEKILAVLKENGLTVRPEKCALGQPEITWFGNVFSKYGMSPDPEKCKGIKEWPSPKSTSEVKSFLQTVQFNAKFLTGMAGEASYPELTQPLRNLTKKHARFSWGSVEEEVFQELKKRLCSDRVVVPFDTSLDTRLYVDSSYAGTQATVAQEHTIDNKKYWRPVNHTSRPWTKAESDYAQIERESNGILTGMNMNRMYTLGTHIEVITDHAPLVPIYDARSKKQRPLRVDRHRTKLLPFNYSVSYEPGKESPCDYGSRHPPGTAEFTESEKEDWCVESDQDIFVNRVLDEVVPSAISMATMQKETREDAQLRKLKEDVLSRKQCRKDLPSFRGIFSELSCINDLILRGEKIVVPKNLQCDIIGLAHEGHQGIEKTLSLIRQTCWFPEMQKLVKEYVQSCKGCLAAVSSTQKVPLEPNLLPDRPWQHLHADYKGPIASKYYLHILIDQFSKFPEVDIVPSTRFEALKPVLERAFATHGIPEKLSSDNGSPYFSNEMADYATEMGIKLDPVTPKDPQCNGFAENFVKTLCKLIHTCAAEGKDPRKELNRFLLQYRATPHLTTGRSPAELLFNRRIRTKLPEISVNTESTEMKAVREYHNSRKLLQKKNFDRRHRTTTKEVKIGDQILIKQDKSTTQPPYDPDPLHVTKVSGNRVTATDGKKIRTRDKNQVKVLPKRPDHLKPSWDRRVSNRKDQLKAHYTLMPEVSEEWPDENLVEESETAITGPSRIEPQMQQLEDSHEHDQGETFSLDGDMAAEMQRLIAQVEQNHSTANSPVDERRVTRSAGINLQWNPAMGNENVLLKEANENEQFSE